MESIAVVAAVAGGAALVGGLVAGVLLLLRERRHRRRVQQLLGRLAEFEALGLLADSAREAPGEDADQAQRPDGHERKREGVRGRLSTLISSLLRRSELAVGEPDRVDVRAVRFLYAHLASQIMPSELARELNVSLRTLQRRIHASLGCGPRDLISAVKMREAKRLLADGHQQVTSVARAVGFEDASYFSKRFRAYYGHSPSRLPETP